MGWCFNVSFPFIRNSFSDFRDFYFQFLVLLVYNIQSFPRSSMNCGPRASGDDPPPLPSTRQGSRWTPRERG